MIGLGGCCCLLSGNAENFFYQQAIVRQAGNLVLPAKFTFVFQPVIKVLQA
jgi:hypothetical protein